MPEERRLAAPLTDYNRGYLDGMAYVEKQLAMRLSAVLSSREWKMVASHSPLCNPEIAQLQSLICRSACS